MTQADSVLSTPPTNTSLLQGLLAQEQARKEAIETVAKLRKQAADEIERLIAFLDTSDGYSATELEDAVDETGCDEDTDKEASLGSSHAIDQTRWLTLSHYEIDAEDEHDGAEPENEHGDRADYEPSLGWTTDGVISNTGDRDCDVEAGTTPSAPQNRTTIPGADAVMVDNSYRRFLHGLTPEQTAALKARMSDGNRVVLR